MSKPRKKQGNPDFPHRVSSPAPYEALNNWYKVAGKAKWTNLTEVQAVYNTAESLICH